MMLTSHLNATRFAQKPLSQPSYSFSKVPKAERDLRGSSLQFIDNDRDAFQSCMAEMLLLCKEAMRRRPCDNGGTGSKPLSLEYLADRFDIDDPLFGFVVRTNENLTNSGDWKRGMLQGFITLTTFTNYQKTFRWDSLNEAAFECDSEGMAMDRFRGVRRWDSDGTLSRGMQSTVHCGDIWNEGIVWPRIAEIGLLGGLGCGKTLIKLAIEHLEGLKATGKCNYDYIVLQATDNSISFYEAMGFVRVGCIMKKNGNGLAKKKGSAAAVSESDSSPDSRRPAAVGRTDGIVRCESTAYAVKKAGETIAEVARKSKVDAWDIIFLNRVFYGEMTPSSRLLAGTVLQVPVRPKQPKSKKIAAVVAPTWHIAVENETPRVIAKKFGVGCLDLVRANKGRLSGLMSNSKLRDGTYIRVSHLDVGADDDQPYPHWSFPDDQFEDPEPSYMMALKLKRRRGNDVQKRLVESSLAVPISPYEPTELLLPPEPVIPSAPAPLVSAKSPAKSRKRAAKRRHPDEPVPPKRPPSSYILFTSWQRETRKEELKSMKVQEWSKLFSALWKELPEAEKAKFEAQANKLNAEYKEKKAEYDKAVAAFKAAHPDPETEDDSVAPPPSIDSSVASVMTTQLYNTVVRLKPGTVGGDSEYKYWYVLTFIPDLRWCHLAPMIQVGKFTKGHAAGKPRWKLVDESLGKELDISSTYCIPVRSRSLKKTEDADKEEWDVIDDGTFEGKRVAVPIRVIETAATKVPRGDAGLGKVLSSSMPRLVAKDPKDGFETYLKLVGVGLHDPAYRYPTEKNLVKQKGASNKVKNDTSMSGAPDESVETSTRQLDVRCRKSPLRSSTHSSQLSEDGNMSSDSASASAADKEQGVQGHGQSQSDASREGERDDASDAESSGSSQPSDDTETSRGSSDSQESDHASEETLVESESSSRSPSPAESTSSKDSMVVESESASRSSSQVLVRVDGDCKQQGSSCSSRSQSPADGASQSDDTQSESSSHSQPSQSSGSDALRRVPPKTRERSQADSDAESLIRSCERPKRKCVMASVLDDQPRKRRKAKLSGSSVTVFHL